MHISYFLIETIVAVEFLLVIFIVFLTYAFRIILFRKKENSAAIKREIKHFFLKHLLTKKPIVASLFPKRWKRLEIIFSLMKEMDEENETKDWLHLKKKILKEIVLPLAREAAVSHDWVLRFFSAQVFSLYSEKSDAELIIKLINDSVPLVVINIIKAALASSEEIVQILIERISQERRFAQTIYLQAFDSLGEDKLSMIMLVLKNAEDPYMRTSCYRIFLYAKLKKMSWDMTKDLNSENLELKLAAIRFFSYHEKSQAIALLVSLLQDEKWEVRVVALSCLESLFAKSKMKEIAECLHDSEWWVRLHAANTLKKFGDEGLAILKKQSPEEDQYAFDIAQYVLSGR